MDIKDFERAKEKIRNEVIDKIEELFSISEFNNCYLNSNESGFYLYFKKENLKLLGFNLNGANSVKQYQKENKKLPIKILLLKNKIIVSGLDNGK